LNLSGNPISEITGLNHLKNLQKLKIEDTIVKNKPNLSYLPNLIKILY
jgi:Leucine-rich repeat (LRR) protein